MGTLPPVALQAAAGADEGGKRWYNWKETVALMRYGTPYELPTLCPVQTYGIDFYEYLRVRY